ncbi:DUF6069 family protein [uncultured Friedmanniella sp.]|uniref:DUF6069 family protein n=1 Tax=uncultured Friedmanniella sp. TaxID=335381 RepID=UPI0035CC675B
MAASSDSLSAATHHASTSTSRSGVGSVAVAVVVNVVVSTLVAFLIGRLAIALGVPAGTMQYQLPALLVIILLASVIGAAGWSIVRRRARHPRGLIRVLAPVVLVVSLVPDVLLGVGGVATWGAVAGLMVMHVAVAALTVTVFSRLLPLPHHHG